MNLFFDFEVLKEDWLICIHTENGEKLCFHNDFESIKKYYQEHVNDIWIGYNVKGYDQFILRVVLNCENPKALNDFIIAGNSGYRYPNMNNLISKFPLIMFDVSNMESLKRLEAYMGGDITESTVSFNLNRPCTEQEVEELAYYCHKDVENTIKVFNLKIEEFTSSKELIEYFGLPLSDLARTKAQLSAKVLNARKISRSDECNYITPSNHKINKYTDVVKFYTDRIGDPNAQENDEFTCNIGGCDHVFKFGGIHGAIPGYKGEGKFINMDVASYYPSLMIEYNLISRNVADPNKFKEIYQKRLEYKAQKDPKQAPLKIVLNSTYGASKDKNNDLYDPKMATSVCVFGQIFLLDLLEHLEPYCQIIQSNTDGVMVKCDTDEDIEKVKEIANEWSERTRMKLEFDMIKKVVQKDVNNYIIVMDDGKIKSKGAYVKKLGKLDYELPIVNKAVTEYLLNDVPVEQTIINSNNKLIEFQQVFKVSSNYEYALINGERVDTKVNRVFASLNEKDGQLLKYRDGTSAKFANSPTHSKIINTDVNIDVPEWLDYNFYIDLANKRIQDFLTVKEKVRVAKEDVAPIDTNIEVEYVEDDKVYDLLFSSIVPLDTDTKKPLGKFSSEKDRKPLSDINNYCYVGGYLREDIICLDFDVKADADKVLNHMRKYDIKCIALETFKGNHLFFRMPKDIKLKGLPKKKKGVRTDVCLVLGCHIDVIVNHYVVIRENATNRRVAYNNGLTELPAVLYPMNVSDDNATVTSCLSNVIIPKRDGTTAIKENYFSLSNLGEGARNSTLTSWAGTIHRNYKTMILDYVLSVINIIMLDAPLPNNEIKAISQSVRGYKSEEKITDEDVAAKLKNYEIRNEYDDLLGYKSTTVSVSVALACRSICGYDIYFDSFLGQTMLENDEGTHIYNDIIRTKIVCNLEKFGFESNRLKDYVRDAVELVGYDNKKDSAIEELENLPMWDNVDRFEDAGLNVGIPNAEQAKIWFSVFMLGTVKRLMSVDAVKHDMAHIIKGPQGFGKSTFFEEIALKREWYTDSVNPSDPEDKIARLQRGIQICEIAEMVGFSVKGDALTKRLLSKKDNHLNEKYKETVKVLPIRCVMCGTTNENELITDPTGSRRFAIAEITKKCDIQYFKDNKAQLYAQAIAQQDKYLDCYYKAENYFSHSNKGYNIEGMYTAKLMNVPETEIVNKTTVDIAQEQLWMEIKSITRSVRNEIAKNLRFLGYDLKCVRVQGNVTKVWSK